MGFDRRGDGTAEHKGYYIRQGEMPSELDGEFWRHVERQHGRRRKLWRLYYNIGPFAYVGAALTRAGAVSLAEACIDSRLYPECGFRVRPGGSVGPYTSVEIVLPVAGCFAKAGYLLYLARHHHY